MLTRLDTISGRLAVSAMKPAAITKASVAAGPKPSAISMAITMGVNINAAPSLANKAETPAPSSTISANKRSEEHTSELQSLMRISYAVFRLNKKNNYITLKKKKTQNN